MNFDKDVFITLEQRIYLVLQIALTGKRIMDQFLEDFKKTKMDSTDQQVFGNLAIKGRVVIERNSPTSCYGARILPLRCYLLCCVFTPNTQNRYSVLFFFGISHTYR